MSQLRDGTETYAAGTSRMTADTVILANTAKQADMNYEAVPVLFPGAILDGMVRGKSKRPNYDRIIEFVEIAIEGDAPATDMIFQLVVDGVVKSQQYTLAGGGAYAYITVTGDGNGGAGTGLVVAAGSYLQAKAVTSTNAGASYAVLTPIARRRIQ